MTRRPRDERGFTLIELMVVVMIIGILVTIGIPTFFGARERANDRAVQSNVRNALTATRIHYNDELSYTDDATAMTAIEPSLGWTNAVLDNSSAQDEISIHTYDVPDTDQTVIVIGRTNTGRCFYLRDVMNGLTAGTYFDRDVDGSGTCPVPIDPATVSSESWSR